MRIGHYGARLQSNGFLSVAALSLCFQMEFPGTGFPSLVCGCMEGVSELHDGNMLCLTTEFPYFGLFFWSFCSSPCDLLSCELWTDKWTGAYSLPFSLGFCPRRGTRVFDGASGLVHVACSSSCHALLIVRFFRGWNTLSFCQTIPGACFFLRSGLHMVSSGCMRSH